MCEENICFRKNFSLSDATQEEISKLISVDVEEIKNVSVSNLRVGNILRIDTSSGNCYLLQMIKGATSSALAYRLARTGKFSKFGFLGTCLFFCINIQENKISEEVSLNCPMIVFLKDDILFTTPVQKISVINIE